MDERQGFAGIIGEDRVVLLLWMSGGGRIFVRDKKGHEFWTHPKRFDKWVLTDDTAGDARPRGEAEMICENLNAYR